MSDAELVESGRRRLFARPDVRAAADVARGNALPARLVGGAVRDALLAATGARGRRGRDLDLSAPSATAGVFAAALAARLGTRVIAVGPPGRRVLRLPLAGSEVDVFESAGSPDEDLLRRDFTVNAMAFDIATGAYEAPAGALADLRAGRLALPRPGVLREDPLRVLRAARFVAELPGFRVAAETRREMSAVARALSGVAAERRLRELDRLLSTPAEPRSRALSLLDEAGALGALLPGSSSNDRRRGLRLVGRLSKASPPVARALLLLPMGERRALEILRHWKTPGKERQIAKRLFAAARAVHARRLPPPSLRRKTVEVARTVSPFFEEAALFLSALAGARARRIASALRDLSRDPGRLARVLRPPRPVAVDEVASLLGSGPGPALGRALAALDLSIAVGDVRSREGALRLLSALAWTPRGARRVDSTRRRC